LVPFARVNQVPAFLNAQRASDLHGHRNARFEGRNAVFAVPFPWAADKYGVKTLFFQHSTKVLWAVPVRLWGFFAGLFDHF
jgi:hypothetical protein